MNPTDRVQAPAEQQHRSETVAPVAIRRPLRRRAVAARFPGLVQRRDHRPEATRPGQGAGRSMVPVADEPHVVRQQSAGGPLSARPSGHAPPRAHGATEQPTAGTDEPTITGRQLGCAEPKLTGTEAESPIPRLPRRPSPAPIRRQLNQGRSPRAPMKPR